MKLERKIDIRHNEALAEMVRTLAEKHPQDYPNESQVWRSAVIALARWKLGNGPVERILAKHRED